MKYFIIFLILIGVVTSPAFAFSEEIINGRSSFELLPSEIMPNTSTLFEIKFQYYDQPYTIESLYPIIEVNPYSARSNVHIEVDPTNVYPGQIFRIPVNMTVDSKIKQEKIFLNLSFIGNNSKTNTVYKSGWTESVTIGILQNSVISDELSVLNDDDMIHGGNISPDKTVYPVPWENISPLKQFKGGVRIDKIQCSESLQLILKTSGIPACVKPDSIKKLLERDWTNSKQFSDEHIRKTILELTKLLESGKVAEFNKLRTEIVSFLLLENVDARGINLDEINLKNTALPGADLRNTTLKKAIIGYADLSNANLQNANLEDADLYHAKLWKTNLNGANLQNTNMKETSLRGADLSNANLQNANLEDADIPITVNLSNTDLRKTNNLPMSIEQAKKQGAIVD